MLEAVIKTGLRFRQGEVPRAIGQRTHITFPLSQEWSAHGNFERFALWPMGGDIESFRSANWTAYYRFKGEGQFEQLPSQSRGIMQLFVCRGEVKLKSWRQPNKTHVLRQGDFISTAYSEILLASAHAIPDTLLIIKFQIQEASAPERLRAMRDYRTFPHFLNNPHTDPLRTAEARPCFSALIKFSHETCEAFEAYTSSISHEFIFLQGEHWHEGKAFRTGDFVSGGPRVDNGWFSPGKTLYSDLSAKNNPWDHLFPNAKTEVFGLLFAHTVPD